MTPATPKRIDGSYLVFRKLPGGSKNRSRLAKKAGGRVLPSFRHETYEAAEGEAQRLCGLFPESTFIIMQEVATVKVRELEQVAA